MHICKTVFVKNPAAYLSCVFLPFRFILHEYCGTDEVKPSLIVKPKGTHTEKTSGIGVVRFQTLSEIRTTYTHSYILHEIVATVYRLVATKTVYK